MSTRVEAKNPSFPLSPYDTVQVQHVGSYKAQSEQSAVPMAYGVLHSESLRDCVNCI